MSTARVDCFESRVAFVGGSPTFVTSASRSPWICTRSLRPRVEARRVRGAQTRTLFQPVCEAASPVPADEEESLDETAMRAAEIHEVLTGLEEFKARIVDGGFGCETMRSCVPSALHCLVY